MLPDSESIRIPIGSYRFQIMKEPDARKKTGQSGKKFTSIFFNFKAINEAGGKFEHMESILAFEDRYNDLLLALGAEEINGRLSGKTVDPVGMMFNADIVHEPDKNDSTKTWARITKIKPIMDESAEVDHQKEIETPSEEDDEIPF